MARWMGEEFGRAVSARRRRVSTPGLEMRHGGVGGL